MACLVWCSAEDFDFCGGFELMKAWRCTPPLPHCPNTRLSKHSDRVFPHF